jgi:hypothetical protein
VVLAAVAAGCSGAHSTKSDSSTATGQRDPTTTAPNADPKSEIYAAVIRRLVMKDHGFGGAPSPYRHVYVRNAVVRGAGDPMATHLRLEAPFAESTRARIAAQLGDLPPLTFVSSVKEATVSGPGEWHAKHRGVLITLGPIRRLDARTVLVSNSRWSTPLNGQWLTYRLELRHGSWRVAGPVGSMAIS